MINNIRYIRKNIFQMQQSAFGALIGVTQASISRWENDKITAEPSLSDIKVIREAALARGLPWDDKLLFSQPDDLARPDVVDEADEAGDVAGEKQEEQEKGNE